MKAKAPAVCFTLALARLARADAARIVGQMTLSSFTRTCGEDGSSCKYSFMLAEDINAPPPGGTAGPTPPGVCAFTIASASVGGKNVPASQTDFQDRACDDPALSKWRINGGWAASGFMTLVPTDVPANFNAYFGMNDADMESGNPLTRPMYVRGTFGPADDPGEAAAAAPTTSSAVPTTLLTTISVVPPLPPTASAAPPPAPTTSTTSSVPPAQPTTIFVKAGGRPTKKETKKLTMTNGAQYRLGNEAAGPATTTTQPPPSTTGSGSGGGFKLTSWVVPAPSGPGQVTLLVVVQTEAQTMTVTSVTNNGAALATTTLTTVIDPSSAAPAPTASTGPTTGEQWTVRDLRRTVSPTTNEVTFSMMIVTSSTTEECVVYNPVPAGSNAKLATFYNLQCSGSKRWVSWALVSGTTDSAVMSVVSGDHKQIAWFGFDGLSDMAFLGDSGPNDVSLLQG